MNKLVIFSLSMILFAAQTFAESEGHHGDPHAIPTRAIFWQVVNVAVIVIAVMIFYRKTINELFVKRRATYIALANKAQLQKQAALSEIAEIEQRLNKLRITRDESIVRAHQEAKEQQRLIVQEAQAYAAKIKKEADDSARLEMGKAVRDFRTALVEGSIESARKVLKTDVGQTDHQRLQKKFVDTVGV